MSGIHPRKSVVWPQAMSLDMAALALDCRRKTLSDAVDMGLLPAYKTDTRIRVLTVDLISYVRDHWPRTTTRRKHHARENS